METKFTPGPWKLNEYFTLISESTKNEIVLGCGLTMCGRVTRDGEIGANAKLIAAAPELLEALIKIVEAHESDNQSWSNILQAKEAIKKATS